MTMYILIKESVPVGVAVNSASHASLDCYLKYKDHPDMQLWLDNSFKKTCCVVNEKEFENARSVENSLVITESRLGNAEVALVFCPRTEYPKMFKFFRLFGKEVSKT